MEHFEMSALTVRAELVKRYFPFPNSLPKLTPVFQKGLISVSLCAMLSLISVLALLVFITHRMISWRRHYKEYVGYNQYVILIYNLLLADLQQSIAFTITFHWLRLDAILAPTAPCFIQGWFLNIGDVASGFFVLAIAIHTWMGVVKGYRLPYFWFVVAILCIWALAVFLTLLGPIIHGNHFFTRAGGWCWVSTNFQKERLWLHYFWVFAVEFGTMAIYGHIFVHLKGRLRTVLDNDTKKLTRATKFMVMYPAVYVVLTLPIAVGRMVAMGGAKMPDAFFCVAGTLLTSCGWIDALLYTLTRRVFVTNELKVSGHAHTFTDRGVTATKMDATRPGDDFDLETVNKEPTGRTVTIVGGSNRMSRMVDRGRAGDRGRIRERTGHPDPLRENSPEGSEDSIIKQQDPNVIGIVTETNIQITRAESGDDSNPDLSTRLQSGNHSHGALSQHAHFGNAF